MIIHSIVPLEMIFQDSGADSRQVPIVIQYMGELVEAIPVGTGGFTISRVLSTSPSAYLNPKLQPGREIKSF